MEIHGVQHKETVVTLGVNNGKLGQSHKDF